MASPDFKKKFVVIDGHALIYRGYFAIPPLRTQKGELVNAAMGFTTVLLNMVQKFKPDYLAVTFDLKGPTFRHEAYEGYKATRPETPEELLSQIPRIKQIVQAFNIPVFEKEGFEADDMIATLSEKLKIYPDLELWIVTGDMDLTQLVNDHVKILAPLTGFNEVKIYDANAVFEKFQVLPEQMVDYKALVGDVSDNIVGVQGIGKKTAIKLLQRYGSLDGIYSAVDSIKGAVHDKLEKGRESAYQSKVLVSLVHDAPLDFVLEDCLTRSVNTSQIRLLFQELEFRRLLEKFDGIRESWQKDQQPTLF